MKGLWFWGCGRERGKVRVEEWGGGMRLWVLDFRGVSDKEKETKRWRPVVARRLWVESGDGDEALHHSTVRQRDRNEKARESLTREKMRKKMNAFFFFFN